MNGRSKTPAPPPSVGDIRGQLERLLGSPPFRSSRRCSDFLRYVVEERSAGRTDQLKERTVGVAVFERDPDYDTNQDPVVRNTAGQVRKRLAQYYCEPGREREVRIDLPAGSYVPEIYVPEAAGPVPEVAPAIEPDRRKWWIAGLAAAVAIAAIAIWMQRPQRNDVDRFWAPLVQHSGTVVLCVGQGHTYKLAGDWDKVIDESGGRFPASIANIPASDVIPTFDRFVGLTDVQALTRLAGLFSKFGKQIEVRGGRTTSLVDLRGRPSVLIGAFNNSWTLSLTGELRFFFEEDTTGKLEVVRDREHPDNRSWQVRKDLSAAQIPMDYAIVSRVFNPTTEKAIVVAAGIRGAGTQAAGEFLTNATYLSQALKDAPPDWAGKNAQFVLGTKMYGGTPGPPTVLASHYW
jgi:hypothetical protein